jgi:hypothetical protein
MRHFHPIHSQDAADAARYWKGKEFKKWAVDVSAGPEKNPTYQQTHYARARDKKSAIASVKQNMVTRVARARFVARLAGPRELGCVPTASSQSLPQM